MERVAVLLADARGNGLEVRADGDRLVVRGPYRHQELARQLLAVKADVLVLLTEEASEIEWRVMAIQRQVQPGRAIRFLEARVGPRTSGHCLSCGEYLAPGECWRCQWCVRAAQQVLGWDAKERAP